MARHNGSRMVNVVLSSCTEQLTVAETIDLLRKLPQDGKVVAAHTVWHENRVSLVVEHGSFQPIPAACWIPNWAPPDELPADPLTMLGVGVIEHEIDDVAVEGIPLHLTFSYGEEDSAL